MANKRSNRFYAVRRGLKPGIYPTWEECERQIAGFSGAAYKSFSTRAEAEQYMDGPLESPSEKLQPSRASSSPEHHPETLESENRIATAKHVIIYTDGACTGNPGPGGYGVVMNYGLHRKELSGGFRLTTNNRMEILGCIVGLSTLKEPCDVTLYSDSRYVIDAISKSWAINWKKRGWKRKGENGELKDALNSDLWQQMLDLCDKHRIHFVWVRGHSGNEGNERCDELARAAAATSPLAIDVVYESLVRH